MDAGVRSVSQTDGDDTDVDVEVDYASDPHQHKDTANLANYVAKELELAEQNKKADDDDNEEKKRKGDKVEELTGVDVVQTDKRDSAGDPNVPKLDKYSEAPNIEQTNANPKITKEVVDEMNTNFARLEKEYQWMFSDTKLEQAFWGVYYAITGFLVILCLLLPLMLFQGLLMLFFFIVYVFTCRASCCGKYKTFMSFYRTFIGKERIKLCLVSMEKRGIFWHTWNRIILFYQNFEAISYTGKNGSPFGLCKIYQQLFGNNFPFLEGIAISDDYDHSYKEVTSLKNRRLGWGVGSQRHQDIASYCLPHVLNSDDARHLISRDLTFLALDWSDMPENKRNYDLNNLTQRIYHCMSAIGKNTKQINEAYYPGYIWYYICNGELLSGKDLAFVGSTIAALSITNPRFTQFLFGNNALLRELYKGVYGYSKLFQRVAPRKKLEKIEDYCNNIGLDRKYGLMIVAINILFAGGRSNARKMIKMITNCQETEKAKKVEEYWKVITNDIKDHTNFFVLETLRHEYSIFPTYNMSDEEKTKLVISGKEYVFPRNTYISLMPPLLNSFNHKYWNKPEEWVPYRNYDKTMMFNTLEMYCPHFNGRKRKNPVTGQEYNLHNISMRFCPGRDMSLNIFRHLCYNLMIESKKEHKVGANEMFKAKLSLKERLHEMFVPLSVMKEEVGPKSGEYQTILLVRPEAFRIVFYCGFFVMVAIGVVLSYVGKAMEWNDFSTDNNPIIKRFGANNICIYFDDPPFTYFSAAIWVVLLTNVLFYQITDFFRTHDAYCDGHVGKKFYLYYKVTTAIETIIFIYFTQSLAVKPDESMIMHTMPYVFLIYAFFFIAIKRYIYFKVTGITDHYSLKIRVLGILYITLLLLSAIGKSFIILPNLYGARMWELDGWKWTSQFSNINEPLFSFLVLICPFFVYWTLNARLETITFTIDRTKGGIRTIEGLKKHIHFMRLQLKEKVQQITFSKNNNGDDVAMSVRQQTVEIEKEIDASPSMGATSVNADLLDALLDEAASDAGPGDAKEKRKELKEKYGFLLDHENYRVFTPESFNSDQKNIVKNFEKNEKEKFTQRIWRSITALLIPVLLFPFMLLLKQEISVIQMLGYALLLMFIGYFFHIFSIFGRVARKRRDLANIYRMYSVSSICPGWTSMSVAYKVYAFEKHPIASISEFSAIDGGIAQTMLLTISCYSWAIVLCGMAFELEEKILDPDIPNSNNFHNAVNVADIVEVIGCFGLVLIGTFDLDPFNPKLQFLHYTGAALGVGTLVGYIWQQYVIGYWADDVAGYIWFPAVVNLIAVVAFILWQYYGFVAEAYPPVSARFKDPSKGGCLFRNVIYKCVPKYNLEDITKVSMFNVTSEATFLFCGALSMCLWLVNYHECHAKESNYCRLP